MTAEEFKAIRKNAGLSTNALAALIRISDGSNIRKIERGLTNVSGPISLLMELVRDGVLTPVKPIRKRKMTKMYKILANGNGSNIVRVFEGEAGRLHNRGTDLIKLVNAAHLPAAERRIKGTGWQATRVDGEGPAFDVTSLVNQHDGGERIAALFGL